MKKPFNEYIFVEPISEEKITSSGIVLPENAEREELKGGVIVAVGPGKINEQGNRIKMSVKDGDIVWFKKGYPTKIRDGNKEYLIIDEADIFAIEETKSYPKVKIFRK